MILWYVQYTRGYSSAYHWRQPQVPAVASREHSKGARCIEIHLVTCTVSYNTVHLGNAEDQEF